MSISLKQEFEELTAINGTKDKLECSDAFYRLLAVVVVQKFEAESTITFSFPLSSPI